MDEVTEIDDCTVLRERIAYLEAILEAIHAGMHQIEPLSLITLKLLEPRWYGFMDVLLCGPDANQQAEEKMVVKYIDEVETALRTGEIRQRSVKR